MKKNGINHYGYKYSICIDAEHGFIRRFVVLPANIHDSQMLPQLLDPENDHGYVWADSTYSGECFEVLLCLGGFESLIHENSPRNHPLSDAARELNHVKSSIRACVEHVFGAMTMGGKLTRKIGLEKQKHGGASRILLSIFFAISNALLSFLRLHKTRQVTHNLHGNLIKKVTQGFLPTRLCEALLCS